MVIVRPFTKDDAKDLARLEKVWEKEGISPGMAGAMSAAKFVKEANKFICFIAEDLGEVIGYALGYKKKYDGTRTVLYLKKGEAYLELDSLYILKAYRRKKVGARLVIRLIAEAKDQGFKSIHLGADSKKQADLVSFYEKFGFEAYYTRMKLDL
jgi:GNAT superfamily N-acetyltransferase